MKRAIIWRKSVYDSGKCPMCGKQVMSADNSPINVLVSAERESAENLFCAKCYTVVAQLQPYDGPGEDGEKMGRWNKGLVK